jgi:hypothetical protein
MMAMFTHRYNAGLRERLHQIGCGVYVHTVNDEGEAARLSSARCRRVRRLYRVGVAH